MGKSYSVYVFTSNRILYTTNKYLAVSFERALQMTKKNEEDKTIETPPKSLNQHGSIIENYAHNQVIKLAFCMFL